MFKFVFLMLLIPALIACGGNEEKTKQTASAASKWARMLGKAPKAPGTDPAGTVAGPMAVIDESPPTAAEAMGADKILAWNNKVQEIIAQGTLADKIAACADLYKETWRLPRRPKGSYVRDLAPAPGMIKGQSAKIIDDSLAAMNKASDDMFTAYGKLEKYMQDPAIQDDGKLGRELAGQITAIYGQYLGARKKFMAIVDEKTEEAEDLLLRGHPLKRQIRLSQSMFAQFREIGDLLVAGEPEPRLLNAHRDALEKLISQAGAPPFTASPSYERLYRLFLRSATNYVEVMERGIREGFHSVQKRELLRALNACRKSYNSFAAAINGKT